MAKFVKWSLVKEVQYSAHNRTDAFHPDAPLEINAAVSAHALISYPGFDLTNTYFLTAGVAGVNPNVATIGSVTYARFAVQVSLQYEFDIREIGENFTTGYIPYGTILPAPAKYPQNIYGSEVFELNVALRDRVSILHFRMKLCMMCTNYFRR